jgi:hypothetical protein
MVWDDPLNNKATRNFATQTEMLVYAWTALGTPVYGRGYIAFDLSGIQHSDLDSARLILHNDPGGTSDLHHQSVPDPNRAWIRRVITPWEEDAVTWNSQPANTTYHQVLMPATTDGQQTYEVNVTELVRDMIGAFKDRSHGFVIILEDETPYRALVFATSDHTDAERRPRLELTFTGSTAVDETRSKAPLNLEVFPNPTSGKVDVLVELPAGSAGYVELFNMAGQVLRSWTVSERMLLHVPLTGLPSGRYWLRLGTDANVTIEPLVVQ